LFNSDFVRCIANEERIHPSQKAESRVCIPIDTRCYNGDNKAWSKHPSEPEQDGVGKWIEADPHKEHSQSGEEKHEDDEED
jgi:hypothetical protein